MLDPQMHLEPEDFVFSFPIKYIIGTICEIGMGFVDDMFLGVNFIVL